MDANDENDKDVGYMCIAANIIIPNEQYFDKPLMRCYDNITYQEALIYCIRCLEENGIAEDGKVNNKDVMHIALKNKLIGIFDYKCLKNIESAISGADYCKLMYKLLNSNRYMYRYDVENEKDSFNHNISEYRCDYVRSVTYKEYLDNPYKYRNSELYY